MRRRLISWIALVDRTAPDGPSYGGRAGALRAVLKRIGLPEPIWVHVEFPRLIHELRSGRIDVIAAGMFITPERAEQVDFTRPTTSVRPGLLVMAGNPLGLHALGDLRRNPSGRLAVLDGSIEWAQAREANLPDAQLLRVPDPGSALAAMRAGQPDIGYPAYAFRRGDPMRERVDLALSGYLGSVEHLQGTADYGFSADDVATAAGASR
ncbi:transporter substrate-binding domain-containing protein [uncultured Sphaerotilus sp.]|uniref:transporter substrate-binding domain-containing protein n=1 Tax=uncultured Sphaerotilus sp. TaxID=474984 RepID=UPI0030CA190B